MNPDIDADQKNDLIRLCNAMRANPEFESWDNTSIRNYVIEVHNAILMRFTDTENPSRHDMLMYQGIIFSLLFHFDPANELATANLIASGKLTPVQCAQNNCFDLDPAPTAKNMALIDQMKRTNKIDNSQSKFFKCNRCGQPVVVRTMSNRSADEQQKVELRCTKCNHVSYI